MQAQNSDGKNGGQWSRNTSYIMSEKKLRFIKDIHIRACNLKVISVLEIIISNKANLFLNF